jgi:hypothetical protein
MSSSIVRACDHGLDLSSDLRAEPAQRLCEKAAGRANQLWPSALLRSLLPAKVGLGLHPARRPAGCARPASFIRYLDGTNSAR